MFERLSRDYINGYTKALLDIIKVFEYIQPDLKHHHKSVNAKTVNQLLKFCLDNRESIREDVSGFVRWNCVSNNFEWFIPKD